VYASHRTLQAFARTLVRLIVYLRRPPCRASTPLLGSDGGGVEHGPDGPSRAPNLDDKAPGDGPCKSKIGVTLERVNGRNAVVFQLLGWTMAFP